MLCIAVPGNGQIKESIIPVLVSAYSILLKQRCYNLSVHHRLTTIIAIRGGLDERVGEKMHAVLLETYLRMLFSVCYKITTHLKFVDCELDLSERYSNKIKKK